MWNIVEKDDMKGASTRYTLSLVVLFESQSLEKSTHFIGEQFIPDWSDFRVGAEFSEV